MGRSTQVDNRVVTVAPHSVEAEEAVLGSIMIDPERLGAVRRRLSAPDFFIVKNGWVYEAILALDEKRMPIDFVTVSREMEARGQLEEIGGPAFLAHLSNDVPTAVHAEGYARIVKQLAVRRSMLAAISGAAQGAYDESNDVLAAMGDAIHGLRSLRNAAAAQLSDEKIYLTVQDLLGTEWPETIWIVPGFMPAGLGFVGGKQKAGKSWLLMQIACAVGSGGRVFNLKVERGPVLYLALEDSERRLSNRARKQQWPGDLDCDFVTFKTFEQEIGDLAAGGAERIGQMVEQRGYRLVVVDTFSKSIGMYMKSGEQNDASAVTKALATLQSVAISQNCAIAFVDHHGKAVKHDGGDPVNDVIGSVAKGGVADWMWGLYRERGKLGATLTIVGRDIDGDQMLSLSFDKEFGCWQYEGDGSNVTMTNRRQEILDAVRTMKRAMLQTIADMVHQPKGHTHDRLQELVHGGLVRRIEEGSNIFYELQDADEEA